MKLNFPINTDAIKTFVFYKLSYIKYLNKLYQQL